MIAPKLYGIYAIVNTANGRIYIGQTYAKFTNRWTQHTAALVRGKHTNKALQSDWNAYGRSVFEFKILESFTKWPNSVYLHPIEQKYIRQWGDLAYNAQPW